MNERSKSTKVWLGAAGLFAALCALPAQGMAKKIVMISWNNAEPRYSITYKAMVEQLNAEGVKDATVVLEDAGGKKEKMTELVSKVKADPSVDIVGALGTSAAVPVSKEITDKPVVIGMVYNPIESKIAKDWSSSANNVTGASNFVSLGGFVNRLVKRSALSIKKIGVIYTPGEKNSELQLADVISAKEGLGAEVVGVPLTSEKDVEKFVADLKSQKFDLLMFTGSNVIGTHIAKITDAAIKAKVMTATHLDDLVARGVLLGLVTDPYEVGKLAGKALVRIVRGAKPSEVRIEYPLPKLVINEKTAQAAGFDLPATLKDWAHGNTASTGTK